MFLQLMFALLLPVTDLQAWKRLQCQGDVVYGRYIHPGKGFSVALPTMYEGRVNHSPAQTGVAIPLSSDCEAVVVIFGEPNSLEWKDARAAIQWHARDSLSKDPGARIHTFRCRLGSLPARGLTIYHTSSDVEELVIAFRPTGGPIYQAHMATTSTRYSADHHALTRLLGGFRLEPWR